MKTSQNCTSTPSCIINSNIHDAKNICENLTNSTSSDSSHDNQYCTMDNLRNKLSEMNYKLTHERILLLAIGEYVKRDFAPPYISDLIRMTEKVERNSKEVLCDFNVPFILDEREKLLKYFYQQAYDAFSSERERKIVFTLTLLQMLKNLGDFSFTHTHPKNNRNELRLSFIIPHLFFAIPYYKFIYDWFTFDGDSIAIQLLFVKFMEIKIAGERMESSWAKFVRPMPLENVSILFGSRNPFHKKALALPSVKCIVNMRGSCDMIEAIKEFIKSGEMQWEKVGAKFEAIFELSCPRNRVGM